VLQALLFPLTRHFGVDLQTLFQMEKIILTDRQGSVVTPLSEIIYCEAVNCYSAFYLLNGKKKLVSKTLKTFERFLCNKGFARVHRKYIINLSHVKQFNSRRPGSILMVNNSTIMLSHRRSSMFRKQFMDFMGAVNVH
jgi:two-component system LytT family response regulator